MSKRKRQPVEPLPITELAERVARLERVIVALFDCTSRRFGFIGAGVPHDVDAMRGPPEFRREVKPQ